MVQIKKNKVFPWGECYYDHFEKYLGNPTGRMVFQRENNKLWLQIITYDNIFEGCRAFCSFGLSRHPLQIGKIAEIFMPIDDGWEETPDILAYCLFQLVHKYMFINQGMAIKFSNEFPDFVSKFGKSAIYISYPFDVPEDFVQVKCGIEMGEIYLGCYISEAEYKLKEEKGMDVFETLLEEKEIDVFNIKRKSSL